MYARIRTLPQNSEEVVKRYKGEVKQICKKKQAQPYSAMDPRIFRDLDETASKGIIEEQGIYNRRGYIDLALPVINLYLAGEDLKVIRTLLDIDAEEVKNYIRGTYVYDMQTKELLDISQGDDKNIAYDVRRHLLGPQYIARMLDAVDAEELLIEQLYGSVHIALPKQYKETQFEVFRGDGNEGFWLIADFYVQFLTQQTPMSAEDFEKLYRPVRLALVAPLNSRVSLLLAVLKNGIGPIKNQIMKYLPVLPEGFRPCNETAMLNPYTAVYNSIVMANNELRTRLMYSAASLGSVQSMYENLVRNIKELMISNEQHRAKGDMQYKPLQELLVGKTGLVRERMLGVRVDYSGRTVIVVDPDMSVDTVGIPKRMIAKLLELNVIKEVKGGPKKKIQALRDGERQKFEKKACALQEGKYEVIGRQPTLFYLGMQAFKVKPVDGSAIVLNPLSTPAFNADFDGDQMHTEIAIGEAAREEVKTLMASTKNLYYPRNGECHIEPRQEILHGLWLATSEKPREDMKHYKVQESLEGYADVYDKVCVQKYNVYDEITLSSGEVTTAGKVAFRYALGYDTYGRYKIGVYPFEVGHAGEGLLKKDWCVKVFGDAAQKSEELFIAIVNRTVKLGFAVVNIYPPDMTVLRYEQASEIVQEFDRNIKEREEFYNLGFETAQSFTAYYNSMYEKMEKAVNELLEVQLDSKCGYLAMSKSGARGNKDNIRQLFGMKGRVKKNELEVFNAVLKGSLSTQLNGLEHAITAYGSRRGLVEKTIETYEPGYLYRQMRHTCSTQVIRQNDCGDTEGLVLDYDMVEQFVPKARKVDVASAKSRLVRDYVVKLLIGRYVVGRDSIIKTRDEAVQVYKEQMAQVVREGEDEILVKKGGIRLRSPITCKCGGCVKCYGVDLTTNKMSVVGTPIGFIAAQAIGEPGTQLTMKNFQSGGVAGAANLTSAFDMLDKYMNLVSLARQDKSIPRTYDYISPVAGYIRTVSLGDGTARLQIVSPDKSGKMKNRLQAKVVVLEGIPLKERVDVGESIQVEQGDYCMQELMCLRGCDYAQKYLLLKLYDLFDSNHTEVNLKHFETLVAGMTYYICMKGNEHFRPGGQYTSVEYNLHDKSDCIFEKTLHGTQRGPLYREDALSGVVAERIREVMQHAVVRGGVDSLTDPLVRVALGLNLGLGSDVPGYLEQRGAVDVQ